MIKSPQLQFIDQPAGRQACIKRVPPAVLCLSFSFPAGIFIAAGKQTAIMVV